MNESNQFQLLTAIPPQSVYVVTNQSETVLTFRYVINDVTHLDPILKNS